MMKRIFLLLALLTAWPALAQTKPSDVPTAVNPWGTAAPYKTDGTANILGDGSANGGGTMPLISKQLTDIPTPPAMVTLWTTTSLANALLVTDPNDEIKARFQANFCFNAYDDAIRNAKAPGASHLHTFFGNCGTNAYSTYASMRQRCIDAYTAGRVGSTASGGPINCTGYWHPAIVKTNPFGDGKNYAVIPFYYVIYYVTTPKSFANTKKRLARGERYVFGVNMDDPDNCKLKNEINLANGGSGTGCVNPTSGRYRLSDQLAYGKGTVTDPVTGAAPGGWGNGFAGYSCYNSDPLVSNAASEPVGGSGTVYQNPVLKNADGSDPWPTCTGPGTIAVILDAPPCSAGTDLWVPGGYDGFRQRVTDTVQGTYPCPNGAFERPQLQIKFYIHFNNAADRLSWRLSSDDMAALASGHPCPNGCSMHTDWFGAWDDTIFLQWQQDGTGVDLTTPVYALNVSTFQGSPAKRLIGGVTGEAAPDGTRSAQVADEYAIRYTTSAAGMKLIPANKGIGPVTINAVPK